MADHEHIPIQHRDGKPPWCRECGLDKFYRVPERLIAQTYDNGEALVIYPPTHIKQNVRQRLAEAIRAGGIDWKKANDPEWRDKPWADGVMVDLDEDDVVEVIVERIFKHANPFEED